MIVITVKFPFHKGFDPSLFKDEYSKMIGTIFNLTCEYSTEGKGAKKTQVIKLRCKKVVNDRAQIKSSFQTLVKRETKQKSVEINLSMKER
ncbi:MAG: hypothetical protein JWM20_127 [Patescibacteria group bacterium]|nr:hypothetical protein [Patescibacteria group bacterium]